MVKTYYTDPTYGTSRKPSVSDRQLLDALPGTAREVGERVGLERSSAYYRLRKLEHEDLVFRRKVGALVDVWEPSW